MKKILHVHDDGTIDASSDLAMDPDAVDDLGEELPEVVALGLACRHMAVDSGQCPCGAELVMLNRKMRRTMFPGRKPQFDGLVTHFSGCPAMAGKTRQWIYRHRRLAS